MGCRLPREPGVYVILMLVGEKTRIVTRGGRRFDITRGAYLYIGSAMGGGGVRGRVMRHIKRTGPLFWHIDYLLRQPFTKISGILYKVHNDRGDPEARLALALKKIFPGVPGFGCSDKPDDYSHLYLCGCSEHECLERVWSAGIEDLVYCRIEDLDDLWQDPRPFHASPSSWLDHRVVCPKHSDLFRQ